MKHYLLLPLALSAMSAQANVRNYSASLDDSTWVVSNKTPIECRMDHFIPSFGVASFISRSSKDVNLDFYLDMYRISAETHQVSLRSVPPKWKPGASSKRISELSFYQQFDGYVNAQPAWQMLSELEDGNVPTFYFNDWYASNNTTAVGISSINFKTQYNDFLKCVGRLLPYSFDDIAFTVLTYQSNSNELTPRSKKRLQLIGDYVKHDPEIDVVLVDAYTDSYGGKWINQELSEKRANMVKDYFKSGGLDESVIEVAGHGERRHVARNDNTMGRERNRRVVISLGKDLL
ncbi:sodium-type flagellar protein MotY [Agarivorans sp. OAG1]|uniref:flagellar protein MotY n=1 Tax=unclassified Agarivorans TaxID=2636026 RepID=UPI00128D0770|nr:OmpA family protein [Agarivorans sp. B2Z047]MPW31055.1 OmpA family protein [Agarivorans sp. B2Z047]UQN40715.1 OmpA family protein [Agarivorans sp. B2Z047]BEU03341.1 sodium-type flagellar protein MotY [Agarivorans sp. OAG1]